MIIDTSDKNNGIQLYDTKTVNLWPTTKENAEGELEVNGKEYLVRVKTGDTPHVWVRVEIANDMDGNEDAIESAAAEVARRGLADPLWAPLAIDLRDGETIYTATFTCDRSAAAIDRFLTQAKDFLEEHGDEVEGIIKGGGDEADEDVDGFARFLTRLAQGSGD